MRGKTQRGSEIGGRIREVLCEHGWTQKYLAEQAGIAAPHVCKIVNGLCIPHKSTVDLMADVLGVSADWLLNGENNMDFAEKLRQAREQKRMTQEELSEIIGIHFSSISNYETGRSMPTSFILKRMCDALDVSADYLLGIGGK